jgi:hypothetical protein
MKRNVLLSAVILLLSCSQRDNGEEGIVIDLDVSKESEIPASSLFSRVKTIILESKDECLIGGVDHIEVFDGYIYVLDRFIAKSLFVFDEEGRFVRKIGEFGNGPGEYTGISDFSIDPLNQEIYLLDNFKLHKYKFDGSFVCSVVVRLEKTDIRFIQYFNGKIFADVCSYIQDDDLLWQIDADNGIPLKSYLKSSDHNCGWNEMIFSGHNCFIPSSNGAPKYTQTFMNTVISLDGIKPLITLKSKDLAVFSDLEEIKKKDTFGKMTSLKEIPKIRDVHDYVESSQFLYFTYWKGKLLSSVLHYFDTHTTHCFNYLKNDVLWKSPRLPMRFMFSDAKGTYEVIHPEGMYLFLEDIENDNLADRTDKREQLLALTEESNPVIFYYEFKHL